VFEKYLGGYAKRQTHSVCLLEKSKVGIFLRHVV